MLLYTEAIEYDEAAEEDEEGFGFYIESAAFHKVTFDIDFDGSDNLDLQGQSRGGALAAQVAVKPYERQQLARLVVGDPYAGWSLKYKMKWSLGEPDAAITEYVM